MIRFQGVQAPAVLPRANSAQEKRSIVAAWLVFSVCVTVLMVGSASGGTRLLNNDVLTQHNDVARTGLNPNETLLTTANVNAAQFGKLFSRSVDGIIVGQPLYASSILMGDGLVHNVVYVTTQHNTVYAFDADNNLGANASPIWQVSLNGAGTPDPIDDYGCTGTHYTEIGITSTPVIDPGKNVMYVVSKTITGDVRNFSLHALDIRTGSELLGGPSIIAGNGPGGEAFNAIYQLQRPALLYQNGLIYIGFGGNGCDLYAYDGWLFAYDATSLQFQGVLQVSPSGKKAGIWQGGSAPAVDSLGNIYVVTANGSFDGPGQNDFGDSVLKLGWNGAFSVLDYFTPYNQFDLMKNDEDLGSSGALILPDQPGPYPHELIAGGKEGTLYLINRDNMGQFNGTADNVVQSIPHAVVEELNGIPTYWNGSVYLGGDFDFIKQYSLVNGMLTSTPVAQTTVPFMGAGPASTSISANGNTNGILWALGHSNQILYAFDAANLANKLYDSTQAPGLRDKLAKITRFVTPTISNGKVYIGGKADLSVFGLLPALVAVAGNNQTGIESQVLPVGLSVRATDAYVPSGIPGVSVTCKDGKAGGDFTPVTQVTDANGIATFTYKLPGKPQTVNITCSNKNFVSATFSETVTTGPPTHVIIVSGNNQTAPINTQLPNPLVVRVADAKNFGISGVTVTFDDKGAGGIFSSRTGVSDANGLVSTNYTTGSKTGRVAIVASSPGLKSANFKVNVQ